MTMFDSDLANILSGVALFLTPIATVIARFFS